VRATELLFTKKTRNAALLLQQVSEDIWLVKAARKNKLRKENK
jgi:hypothetical protein